MVLMRAGELVPPGELHSSERVEREDVSLEYLQMHRVACAIVSHTIEESGGSAEDGKVNEHLIDYAISKIRELRDG